MLGLVFRWSKILGLSIPLSIQLVLRSRGLAAYWRSSSERRSTFSASNRLTNIQIWPHQQTPAILVHVLNTKIQHCQCICHCHMPKNRSTRIPCVCNSLMRQRLNALLLNSMCSIGFSLLQSDSSISPILITIIMILLISIERVCPPGLLLLLPSRAKHRNRSWRHKISELRSSQYRNTLTGERKYTPQRAKRHKTKMRWNTNSEISWSANLTFAKLHVFFSNLSDVHWYT